jgi:hypothetical protein
VAEALVAHFHAPGQQILVYGLVARAAGGAGRRAAYERGAAKAWELADSESADESTARALLGVAHGAASLGEWQAAEAAAVRALKMARERKEGRVVVAAEAALESIRTGLRTQTAALHAGRPEAEHLAVGFVRALRREHVVAGA